MKIRINKQNVDDLDFAEKGQIIYRDTDLIGFAVRVTPKSKTFIVDRKYNNELFRVVVGQTDGISAAGARKKAQLIISQILNGEFIKKQALKDEHDPLLLTKYQLKSKHVFITKTL